MRTFERDELVSVVAEGRERQNTLLPLLSVLWKPVVDLGVSETHVVSWRADDADSPVIRSLIESARDARTLLAAERG